MHKITIQSIESLNHNVRRFVADKPDGYEFKPGQATLVAIDKEGQRDEKRPFTFTSLPNEDRLEFTIKIYPSHDGVTDDLDDLKTGDKLIIEDSWGAIQCKGKGTFIAGGAGITPFLAILRDQFSKDSDAVEQIIFANKTKKDLFLEEELNRVSDGNLLLIYSEDEVEGAEHGRVDEAFLRTHIDSFHQFFYVCGPPEMVDSVESLLKKLGTHPDKIITEES